MSIPSHARSTAIGTAALDATAVQQMLVTGTSTSTVPRLVPGRPPVHPCAPAVPAGTWNGRYA